MLVPKARQAELQGTTQRPSGPDPSTCSEIAEVFAFTPIHMMQVMMARHTVCMTALEQPHVSVVCSKLGDGYQLACGANVALLLEHAGA